jgi:RNA recognition motif-containing protein
MGRRLFVGNLSYQTDENELTELFGQFGAVENAQIMRDMATGRARGFAFVEMATDEEAAAAATGLNNTQFGGRTIAVNEARPREQRSGGPGGGGGGRGGRSFGGGGGGGGGRREPRW